MHRIPRHTLVIAGCAIALLGLCSPLLAEPDQSSKASVNVSPDLQAYYSGNGLLNRGLYDLAAKEYRAFLDENAEHEKAGLARYGLAVCLFKQNKLDEAETELQRLQEDDGFAYAAEVATMLGQCHLAKGDFKDAIRAFEIVTKQHAKHALADDAAAQLIEALHRDGQDEAATRQYAAFAKQWPASPLSMRAGYFAGLAAMRQNDCEGAVKALEPIATAKTLSPFAPHATLLVAQCHHKLGHASEAEQTYRKVLTNEAGVYAPDAMLGLATLLHQQNKNEEAARWLDTLLDKHSTSPLADSARLLRGQLWFETGQYDDAAKAFAKLQGREESELARDAAYWAAKCLLRQGDNGGAAKAYEKAIGAYPKHERLAEMEYDLAIARYRAGEIEKAADALNAFRKEFPKHELAADTLHLLVSIAHRQADYDLCRKLAEAFVKQYRDHPLLADVQFLNAESAYLAEKYEQAVTDYEAFLKQHDKSDHAETARYRLGMALYRLNKPDEAYAILSKIQRNGKPASMLSSLDLALGDLLFQKEDWTGAEHHLTTFLNGPAEGQTTAVSDALLKLGIAYQRQNKHEKALAQFDELIRKHENSPHHLQAMFERGQVLVAMDHSADAIEAFRAVLAKGEDSRFAVPSRKHLAALLLQDGDAAGAAEQYDQVAKAEGDSDTAATALFQQTQALLASHDYAAAEKILRKLIDKHKASPHLARAKANLAIALSRQDKHQDALHVLADLKLSELDANMANVLRYEQAWCLRETGKHDEAAKAYQALIEANPEPGLLASALLEVAQIRIAQKQHNEAIDALKRLRELAARPGTTLSDDIGEQAAYCLGTSLFQTEQYAEAANILSEFIDRHAESKLLASARFFRGEALFKLGKHGEAEADFALVAKADDGGETTTTSLLRLGECYAAQQRWARSEKAFTDYIERRPDSEQWYQAEFGLGWARENQGRYAEAAAAYRHVVEKHEGPTAARAQFQIGQCLFAQKQHEDAVRELLKVDILYAYPQWSAAALFEAGRCFEAMRKTAEARQQFQSVIDKYGDTRWAEMARSRLTTLAAAPVPGQD